MNLLADLASLLLEVDPAPETAIAAAAARRRLGADRLPQVADSAWPGEQRRGPRRLVFAAPGTTLEVELGGTACRRWARGLLVSGFTSVTLWHAGGAEDGGGPGGRFAVRDLPAGPISFVLNGPGRRPLATDWLCC
ncbi:hypothetical protein [Allokutzneria albata]|uniref:Uncharacterized protein n=1 Tax=Allokutzneria albata TaxID=211114 RepID=A0A1G9Z6W2_ALLAB|nr:hypothetical protein [Allokutzneria albata]SDN17318.1 hypothetical protein SAMN04489726_5322 [Allokutzneria albata]